MPEEQEVVPECLPQINEVVAELNTRFRGNARAQTTKPAKNQHPEPPGRAASRQNKQRNQRHRQNSNPVKVVLIPFSILGVNFQRDK